MESDPNMENFLEETVNHEHIFKKGKVRETTKNPPLPFTTSGLQQSANTNLRISPKATMKICQKLYESGLITYMRTDSRTYSKEFIKKAKGYIKNEYGDEYIHDNVDKLSERNEKKSKKKKKDDNLSLIHI